MSGSGSSSGRWSVLHKKGESQNPYLGGSVSTGNSSALRGNVTIDPRIRQIQEQGLSRNTNLYNQLDEGGREIMGNLRGTRSRFEGNQSDYTQSRINPVEQEYATRQGGLERSIGLRGLSGSSFGDQAMTSFATEKQRGIGDIRAQAEMENLQALTGIDSQMTQTLFNKVSQQANLTGMDNETAKAMLMQELQGLGLGEKQIDEMTKTFESYQNRLLTAGPYQTSQSGSGGGKGSSSPDACFVAEVIYGVDSNITHTIRAYVRNHAGDDSLLGRFFRLYIKHGKTWASVIDGNRMLTAVAKILWDKLFKMSIKEKKTWQG